jgi:hypothetical protein
VSIRRHEPATIAANGGIRNTGFVLLQRRDPA